LVGCGLIAQGHELGVDYLIEKAAVVHDADLFGVDVEQNLRILESVLALRRYFKGALSFGK